MGAYQSSIYISNLVIHEEHTSQILNTWSVLCSWRWLRSRIISLISGDMLLFFDTNWSPSVIGSDKRLTFRTRFYLVLQIPERISSQTSACLLLSSQIQFSLFAFLSCTCPVWSDGGYGTVSSSCFCFPVQQYRTANLILSCFNNNLGTGQDTAPNDKSRPCSPYYREAQSSEQDGNILSLYTETMAVHHTITHKPQTVSLLYQGRALPWQNVAM